MYLPPCSSFQLEHSIILSVMSRIIAGRSTQVLKLEMATTFIRKNDSHWEPESVLPLDLSGLALKRMFFFRKKLYHPSNFFLPSPSIIRPIKLTITYMQVGWKKSDSKIQNCREFLIFFFRRFVTVADCSKFVHFCICSFWKLICNKWENFR